MELPYFKYNPNAYALGIFKDIEGICSVCNQKRKLKYTSSFYSLSRPDYICPWCICDGSAATRYAGEFNDYCGIEGISPDPVDRSAITIPKEAIREIVERTPSYHSWQQEVWLTHCNEPCIFIGYVDSQGIEPYLEELKEDIEYNIGISPDILKQYLTSNGSLVGYLFQCAICGQHRLHADSD